MRYRIDSDHRPAYLQLYEQLKHDILNGGYAYGDRLPSKRILAAELGLSVAPVAHTYVLLCEEGYVEARERSGYFVCYRSEDFLLRADMPINEVLPNTASDPDDDALPYTILAKAMRQVITDKGEHLLEKSPNQGLLSLRQALSGYLMRACGIMATPAQIVIGSGAEYLYGLLVQLLGRSRTYALETPCYEKIQYVYGANGVQCEFLPLVDGGISSRALTASDAGVLHVTPFHSYPSGITANRAKRLEYIEWARAHQATIIEDNYNAELTVSENNDTTLYALANGVDVIYLNTFSHTISPALRVGYMVLPLPLVERFEERLGFYSCTVPTFEQYLLTELLQNGDFERHINRLRHAKRQALKHS